MTTVERLRAEEAQAREAILQILEVAGGGPLSAVDIARKAQLPSAAVRRAVWPLVDAKTVELTEGLRIKLVR